MQQRRKFARIMCIVLAIIMVVSLAIPALADETETTGKDVTVGAIAGAMAEAGIEDHVENEEKEKVEVPKPQWVKVDGNDKYRLTDGTYATSTWIKKITDDGTEKWYVDGKGNMVKNNWCRVDGKWYTFGADGKVATKKWIERDDGTWIWSSGDGLLTLGWQTIGGKDFHFNEKGLMDTGWLTENNTKYFLQENGEKAYGWVESSDTWYYMDPKDGGRLSTGERLINGKRYLFDYVTGEMVK